MKATTAVRQLCLSNPETAHVAESQNIPSLETLVTGAQQGLWLYQKNCALSSSKGSRTRSQALTLSFTVGIVDHWERTVGCGTVVNLTAGAPRTLCEVTQNIPMIPNPACTQGLVFLGRASGTPHWAIGPSGTNHRPGSEGIWNVSWQQTESPALGLIDGNGVPQRCKDFESAF